MIRGESLLSQTRERAFLVGVVMHGMRREEVLEHVDELALLADTAGAEVVGREIQTIRVPNSAFFIGTGKVREIAQKAEALGADVILFDEDLTPVQAKNLEKVIKRRVVDRSGLILDIFARRARTREAQMQVALAQLEYLLPRLTRQWTHLERQEGVIGTRGPGETQLETDRRLITKRIEVLKRELEKISKQRKVRRDRRSHFRKVALVGYTNAGKSSLLNAFTKANVFVEDRLFATLDTTIRALPISRHEKVLLIDTVGFIRKLPHHLVASFRSTLEETLEADLLLHVVDVSHPHFEEQMEVVHQVLKELGIGEKPMLLVFNKIDRLEDREMFYALRERYPEAFFVSALRGIGLQSLTDRITHCLKQEQMEVELCIPLENSEALKFVYAKADVLETRYENGMVCMKCQIHPVQLKRVKEWMVSFRSVENSAK